VLDTTFPNVLFTCALYKEKLFSRTATQSLRLHWQSSVPELLTVKKILVQEQEMLLNFNQSIQCHCFDEGRPRSPPGDYCRIIPAKDTRRRVGPPVLPPQLLQIVLNQEVPRHVSLHILQ